MAMPDRGTRVSFMRTLKVAFLRTPDRMVLRHDARSGVNGTIGEKHDRPDGNTFRRDVGSGGERPGGPDRYLIDGLFEG
jgi:hypothetical protein